MKPGYYWVHGKHGWEVAEVWHYASWSDLYVWTAGQDSADALEDARQAYKGWHWIEPPAE